MAKLQRDCLGAKDGGFVPTLRDSLAFHSNLGCQLAKSIGDTRDVSSTTRIYFFDVASLALANHTALKAMDEVFSRATSFVFRVRAAI